MFQILNSQRHLISGRRAEDCSWQNTYLAPSQYVAGCRDLEAAIVAAAYLYKNENFRIDQRLKVISMCLPSIFSISAPLIDRPESELKLLIAVWV